MSELKIQSKFEKDLSFEVGKAKFLILKILKSGPITGVSELKKRVFSDLTLKRDKDGFIVYNDDTGLPVRKTKPVHRLAFIKAYKELEQKQKIQITRPPDIPFPMTDNQTIFSLKETKTK